MTNKNYIEAKKSRVETPHAKQNSSASQEFNLSDKINIIHSEKGKGDYLDIEFIKEFIQRLKDIPLTAEQLAKEFHNHYENFASNNEWKTQDKCQVAFDDLPEKNKQTMIDTCQHILLWIEAIMFDKRNKLAGDKFK